MCGLLLYIKSIKTTLCQLWQWLENSQRNLQPFWKFRSSAKNVTDKATKVIARRLKKACSSHWLHFDKSVFAGKQECERVKDYMKINCKLIDPDRGVNLAKKKAHLGLCENISPKSPDEFPREEYNDDLSDVPVVDYNIIWKFMVQNVSGKGTSTAKPLIKGYNFIKSGHVVKLEKQRSTPLAYRNWKSVALELKENWLWRKIKLRWLKEKLRSNH